MRTQHAPSNPSLKSQTVQTDASSIGRVTGGNLTLFYLFIGANIKKDATVAKVKKLNAFHYKGGRHVRRDVTRLGVMSRAAGDKSMQDAHVRVVNFTYAETLDLSLKLRLQPDMIPMLVDKLIGMGMSVDGCQNDDICDLVCKALVGFVKSYETAQTTEEGGETNAGNTSGAVSNTEMVKAVKMIHHDIYLTLMEAGITPEEAGLQMTVSDQEVIMWWLLLDYEGQDVVHKLFTTSMFRLAKKYYMTAHSVHLPGAASLGITVRRVVRGSSPSDYDMLKFCNEGPDGLVFMVAVVANIVNGTTDGNIMCGMKVLEIATLLMGFVERRSVSLTVTWWAQAKDGIQEAEANSINGAASNADARAAGVRAKDAAAGMLAPDNEPDVQARAGNGRLESRRRPREDDEDEGPSHGHAGSSWRQQGAIRRRRVLSGLQSESEEQPPETFMTEEEQLRLAIEQVADSIEREAAANKRMDEDDDANAAGSRLPDEDDANAAGSRLPDEDDANAAGSRPGRVLMRPAGGWGSGYLSFK